MNPNGCEPRGEPSPDSAAVLGALVNLLFATVGQSDEVEALRDRATENIARIDAALQQD